jgi:type IV pilus assembly protein PilA
MVLKQQLKKRNNKKGFTLVEVIVVLVILAILAAIAIPALTGYIDKANNKAVISQTRTAVLAAQTIVSDAYGTGVTSGAIAAWATANVTPGAIQALSGDATITAISELTLTGTAIEKMTITANGKTGKYDISATPKYSVG